ncbi:glycosyltransferase family 4 protein [Bacteroidia bacterium]|nr:glycosyltransferase family 4 protein [Bacteroidia bacterium]
MRNRILIVASEFPPLPGGIGNHAFNLANSLTNKKYKVSVLTDCRSYGNKELVYDNSLSFNVIRILLKKNRMLMYFKRVQQLFSLAKENDIVIASGKFSLWIVGLLSFFYNRKFIAIVHGTEVNSNSNFFMSLVKFSLERMDVVISVSEFTQRLISHFKLKKSIVISNGYHIESHNITPIKFNTYPNLVTLGRVSERKGQINVVNALPAIKKKYPTVCYRMIGIPEDKESLMSLANSLGVDKNIIFYGQQEYSELYSIIKSSDIFMMLSQNDAKGDVEGFGIAILESNFFSVPAIGSLGCGIEDAINNKISGILIEPQQSNQVLLAITEILQNHLKYKKQAKKWSNDFTWDKIVMEYIKEL